LSSWRLCSIRYPELCNKASGGVPAYRFALAASARGAFFALNPK
jgi:hypothetical protein